MKYWCGRLLVGLALIVALAGLSCLPLPSDPGTGGGGPPVFGGGGPTTSAYCEPVGTPDSSTQQDMFQALNNHRVANGLAELVYSDTLEEAAQFQARDMYERNFFDHTNPDGDTVLDRAIAAGFCDPSLVGENIAYGHHSVAQVQAGWQGSPGHNANMLNTEYTFAGMGHYTSPLGVQYWVQVFGKTYD
jgi:uncharacterized protein YkwD